MSRVLEGRERKRLAWQRVKGFGPPLPPRLTAVCYACGNGPTCALSPFALAWPFMVSPVPQGVFGFPSFAEALAAQHYTLTASVDRVAYMAELWRNRPDVETHAFKNFEPCTDGQTLWSQV